MLGSWMTGCMLPWDEILYFGWSISPRLPKSTSAPRKSSTPSIMTSVLGSACGCCAAMRIVNSIGSSSTSIVTCVAAAKRPACPLRLPLSDSRHAARSGGNAFGKSTHRAIRPAHIAQPFGDPPLPPLPGISDFTSRAPVVLRPSCTAASRRHKGGGRRRFAQPRKPRRTVPEFGDPLAARPQRAGEEDQRVSRFHNLFLIKSDLIHS